MEVTKTCKLEGVGNNAAAVGQLAPKSPGRRCFGSAAYRRLHAVRNVLAEDYLLGRYFQRLRVNLPFHHFLLTPLMDALIALLWFAPFISRTIA